MKRFRINPFVGYFALFLSKRFARRRGPAIPDSSFKEVSQIEKVNINDNSNNNVNNLRFSGISTGGMLAAPATTSLDRIQAEIRRMQAEHFQQKALQRESASNQEKKKNIGGEPSRNKDSIMGTILNHYRAYNKPNEIYYNGKEIVEGLTEADTLAYELFINHVDEFMRPKSREIAERYAEIFFPQKKIEFCQKELLELLDKIEGKHQLEKKRLQKEETPSEDLDAVELSRLAWLRVLNGCEEADIRLLWKRGILDTDVIESLLASPAENSHLDEPASARREEGEGDAPLPENDDGETTLLLDEKISQIRRCFHLKELTAAIRRTQLAGKPSCDLAPAVRKAKQRRFGEISAKELSALEKLEEARQTPGTGPSLPSEGPPLTESLLSRALLPSNEVLFEIARTDERVFKSLEVLEQIKRAALFDPHFRAAVEFAHGLEELSVKPYVRPFDGENNDHGETEENDQEVPRGKQRRIQRQKRKKKGVLQGSFYGLAGRPYHAADRPHFFNSVYSFVPSRGNFNLPAPAPSREEKAALRGIKRRIRGRTRFGK